MKIKIGKRKYIWSFEKMNKKLQVLIYSIIAFIVIVGGYELTKKIMTWYLKSIGMI